MFTCNLSLGYHIGQLHQVAADLRAERTLATSAIPAAPGALRRFRGAIGTAIEQVASTLFGSQARPGVEAR